MLVVGLGNPGDRYANTPHNIGFAVAARLVEECQAGPFRTKFEGEFASFDREGQRVLVLRPSTFMNLSGRSVRAAMAFFKLSLSELVVIHDELDLPLGTVRIKEGGGDAGHHGLESVSGQLGSSAYLRVRCGIGRPPPEFGGTVADYLLERFPLACQPQVQQLVLDGVDAVERLLRKGAAAAMNLTNRRRKA